MRQSLLIILFSFIFLSAKSQSQGKPTTEIFADFHSYSRSDTSLAARTGFGLTRVYLGYNYQTPGNFTASAILNIASPSDLAPDSKERRYAFFREASVSWTNQKLSLAFGMTTTRALIFQQRFYNKRYITDNFLAYNGYYAIADLGFTADYIVNDILKIDFSLMNGEGYNNLHIDNSIRSSFGINIIPIKKGVIRLYADYDRPMGVWQQLYIGFLGYKTESLMIGGEAVYKTNHDLIPGHDSWGFTVTGSVRTSEKTEIFGRYDYTNSNIVPENNQPWNYESDRKFFVGGLQYTFNEFFRLAIDYQGSYPNFKAIPERNAIFLNAHFKL